VSTPKTEENSHLQRVGADVLLRLAVQPRAAPEGPDGMHAGRLRLKVGAAPVDDAANARVVRLLSELLDLPRASIRILRGHHSRNKDVLLRDAGAAFARIAAMAGPGGPAPHTHNPRARANAEKKGTSGAPARKK
jgi:uncharacterized protein